MDLLVKRKIIEKAGGGNFKIPTADGKMIGIRGTQFVIDHWRAHPQNYGAAVALLKNSEPLPDEIDADVPVQETEGQDEEPKLTLEEQLEEVAAMPSGKLAL
jgi:hypothetical protein